jgi:hypothetical protein
MIYLLKICTIFRWHNNMIYLFNFNITYTIIFATCFDPYESSSGINFKNCCTYCFTVFFSYYCNRDRFSHYKSESMSLWYYGRGVVGLWFVMRKGIATAIVRQKNVRHKNCKTICTIVLEIYAWRWLIRVETCSKNNYIFYIEVR